MERLSAKLKQAVLDFCIEARNQIHIHIGDSAGPTGTNGMYALSRSKVAHYYKAGGARRYHDPQDYLL